MNVVNGSRRGKATSAEEMISLRLRHHQFSVKLSAFYTQIWAQRPFLLVLGGIMGVCVYFWTALFQGTTMAMFWLNNRVFKRLIGKGPSARE